jgi:hypothetical protein
MAPTTLTNVAELTKEEIGDLYFLSLGKSESRKLHMGLANSRSGPTPVAPSVHEFELDFKCWYCGILDLVAAIDPGARLPPAQIMVGYIVQNFERAKTAIVAAA